MSFAFSLPADSEGDLILLAVGDRRVVHAGHQHFAALGEAPPLLLLAVGSFTVNNGDKQAVFALVALDQALLLQRAPEKFGVCADGKILLGSVAVDDLNGDGLVSRRPAGLQADLGNDGRRDQYKQDGHGNDFFRFCGHKKSSPFFFHRKSYKEKERTGAMIQAHAYNLTG